MISNLILGFVSILIGVSLVGTIATQVDSAIVDANSSGTACTSSTIPGCSAVIGGDISSWGNTVLRMSPGFFALGILAIGIAVTYSSLREAGIV